MLKSCTICGGIHSVGAVCPKRKVNKKNRERIEEKFRGSNAWKNKREQIRKRDGYMCRWCLATGDGTRDSYRFDKLSVHHIVPLAVDFDKRLDDDNLVTLCPRCHEEAEKGAISAEDLQAVVLADIPPVL